ncbi:MAG: DNA-binding protein [Nitrospinae bacterium]|nr:DNA-binding protein [Nitrospinota bacterium]MBI3815277.1 DNA-binding protein [Nitrospinota bacterium]
MILYYTLGNTDILKLHKTAFLCSRKCPADVVLKSYDWAIERREKGDCVISGFHSKIEKDVLHYLLKGSQPVILALARGFKKRLEPELKKALDDKRLLIITPFEEKVKRVTSETSARRNRLMAEVADEIFVAYASKGGNLEILASDILKTGKLIHYW